MVAEACARVDCRHRSPAFGLNRHPRPLPFNHVYTLHPTPLGLTNTPPAAYLPVAPTTFKHRPKNKDKRTFLCSFDCADLASASWRSQNRLYPLAGGADQAPGAAEGCGYRLRHTKGNPAADWGRAPRRRADGMGSVPQSDGRAKARAGFG